MRILFVTGEYPPMQGGVGDYTWSLGTALGNLGVDVSVLTSRDAGPNYLVPQGVANVYTDVDKWSWGLSGQVRRLAQEIEPDVVHIQYQSAAYRLHPAINLLPRRLRGARWPRFVAVTFHDLRVPYLFPKAGPLRWQINLEPARQSDRVIVTNKEDHERLNAYAGLAAKLVQVPIGSNIQPEPGDGFDRAAQRARWGVGPQDLLLCYFGFLNDSKGGEELMQATARLASAGVPVHLLMIGGQVGASDLTNFAYLEQVKALISQLGLDDRVHWTGFVAAGEVSANFLAADMALLPYRDGASFRRGSLMAALAHGLPVISTEPAVPIPELQHGQNIWLVPAQSPQALALAAEQLWQDRPALQRLGEGARQLSLGFTWDAIARRHLEVYRGLE
jgi:glycosyltransferase involved in cell wall biosynthesis